MCPGVSDWIHDSHVPVPASEHVPPASIASLAALKVFNKFPPHCCGASKNSDVRRTQYINVSGRCNPHLDFLFALKHSIFTIDAFKER